MELTIKHISPYLPFMVGLSVKKDTESNWAKTPFHVAASSRGMGLGYAILLVAPGLYKMALRPMSDIDKEICIEDWRFNPLAWLNEQEGSVGNWGPTYPPEHMPYWAVEQLLSWHFDVFGLIDAGLAVDINTLGNE